MRWPASGRWIGKDGDGAGEEEREGEGEKSTSSVVEWGGGKGAL